MAVRQLQDHREIVPDSDDIAAARGKVRTKATKVSEEILGAQQNKGFLLRGRSGVGGETRRSVGCGIPARQVVDETNRP